MGKDLRVVSDTIRTNRSLIPPPPLPLSNTTIEKKKKCSALPGHPSLSTSSGRWKKKRVMTLIRPLLQQPTT